MPVLPTDAQLDMLGSAIPLGITGRVSRAAGQTLEAEHLPLPIGQLVEIEATSGLQQAEVIGFRDGHTLLMPLSGTAGVAAGDRVSNTKMSPRVRTGSGLLGRVIDGFGKPIDGLGSLPSGDARPLDPPRLNPLIRVPIRKPLATGVRAIDALLTCGRGQRVGLFAGPGVGKSTLMAHVAKHTDADVSVIALIGERGREVADFLHDTLGPEGLKRSVVIVSTGDDTPLLKVRAAKLACAVAEGFRDAGQNVLLLMDSLTRLAHAQRQIGLAAGEPPATRGYPPSVFALLPSILERAGTTQTGTITGFYTVLVEGDDFDEPIADAVKGIADGHFLLSRKLAERGHYPAIDVLQSVSRVRTAVTDPVHRGRAERILQLESMHRDLADLLSVGAYASGQNPEHDLAVAAHDTIQQFLRQVEGDHDDFAAARRKLDMIHAQIENAAAQMRAQQGQAQSPPQQ